MSVFRFDSILTDENAWLPTPRAIGEHRFVSS
jgi:hypothetical protein